MFDGFEGRSFGSLCVQAKSLKMYVIDTCNNTLLRTIDNNQILPKSIFKDQKRRDEHQAYYEGLKELIEKESHHGRQEFIHRGEAYLSEQELIQQARAVGNTVLIPKLNEEFIAVRVQHTLLIKIYDIKKKKYVRQFLMDKGEDYLDL